VHLNFPFREPLVPVPRPASVLGGEAFTRPDGRPYTRVHDSTASPCPATVAELAHLLAGARRGLVVCGPLDAGPAASEAITRLAALLGYPVLADATSQLRGGPDERGLIVDAYDVLLRETAFARTVAPEAVLRIGRQPTSKALLAFLARQTECRQVVIDPFGGWDDPSLVAADLLWCEPEAACTALAERLSELPPPADRAWLERWRGANRRARRTLDDRLADLPDLFEGRVFAELARILPPGSSLYAGNSMAMRDLEVFWPSGGPQVRILCNRGANGIDGFVSSALGAAAVSAGPLVAVTGDLGFYHDLNGLLAARRYGVRATFVVLNDDGGGIFSYLPQADCGPSFTELFLTPHGLDFRGAVEMYGCRFSRIAKWDEFRSAVTEALEAPVTSVIEVPIAHQRSVELHRWIWAAAGRAGAGVAE
jgi:2-succinyl-5-enolpyruvyl-6-hydroxy-3-cyclohexene-1-carboxylate synthase